MRYEKDREAVRQCALCIPALEGQDQSQHNRRISGTVWVGLCAFLLYTSAAVPSEWIWYNPFVGWGHDPTDYLMVLNL